MDIDLPGPDLKECCFCIELKMGAYILGILSIIGAIFGVVDIFIVLSNFQLSVLGVCIFALSNFLPAIAFVLMLQKPSVDSKKRFASWWFLGGAIGTIAFFVLMLLGGAIIGSIVGAVIQIVFIYYFYLCLKAFSKATDLVDSAKASLV